MHILSIIENFETVMSRNMGVLLDRNAHPTEIELSKSLNHLARQDVEEINAEFLKLEKENRLFRWQIRRVVGGDFARKSKYKVVDYLNNRVFNLLELKEQFEKAIIDLTEKDYRFFDSLFDDFELKFKYKRPIYSLNTPTYIYTLISVFCDYWYIKENEIKDLGNIEYLKKRKFVYSSKLIDRQGFIADFKSVKRSTDLNSLIEHYKIETAYLEKILAYFSLAGLILSQSFFQSAGVKFDLVDSNKYPRLFKENYYMDLFDIIYLKLQDEHRKELGITFFTFMFYYFQDLGFIHRDTRPIIYRDFLREEYGIIERQLQTKVRGMKYQYKDLIMAITKEY